MLNQIIETKKDQLNSFKMPEQEDVVNRSFYDALKKPNRGIGLIAEVKKASPSKGIIKEDFHPLEIAKEYEKGGADAISVLTETQYFHGSNDYLKEIKKKTNLPILRKDFIIDIRQIEESKRIGADAILLISEVLEAKQLQEYYERALELGLDCLVEVHSEKALESILSVFVPEVIGVNNRDLKTFVTSLEQTQKLANLIPKNSLFVSESGIHTPSDLEVVQNAGAHAVLVGESLMRASSPFEGIQQLYGRTLKNEF